MRLRLADLYDSRHSSGLVALHPLDDGGLQANDLIGPQAADITLASGGGYRRGITAGEALHYPADTAQYAQGNDRTLNNPLTVTMWINPVTVASGIMVLFANGNAGGGSNIICEINRTAAKLSTVWSGTLILTGSVSLIAGKWTHVAWTRSGVSASWTTTTYVNGLFDASATTATNPGGSGASNYFIGRFVSSLYAFSGRISRLKVWQRCLSPTEILQDALGGNVWRRSERVAATAPAATKAPPPYHRPLRLWRRAA